MQNMVQRYNCLIKNMLEIDENSIMKQEMYLIELQLIHWLKTIYYQVFCFLVGLTYISFCEILELIKQRNNLIKIQYNIDTQARIAALKMPKKKPHCKLRIFFEKYMLLRLDSALLPNVLQTVVIRTEMHISKCIILYKCV